MNINQIKDIYQLNGLNDFKVTSHQDLNDVHGINVAEISGYSTLSKENRDIFDEFIVNFYNAQGLESRSALIPVRINYVLYEEYLGKIKDSDDYYIPLGGKITALLGEEQRKKVLSTWKDKKYKSLLCIETELQKYLRFDYKNGKHKEWQHVKSASVWY